ncbi:hypothetical protein I3F58_23075 [Streptomyces sp. MUM 203J]|uniref:hypothetical protein n=1 Tax=Streptomyces sp. MUM 203J TaxID=2791990 RepID=UPI001F03F9B3|nr:hypothetical protein [Streptomyces sp. MUM 203J]MCH0542381.1 hypothetical protein [Streptomyces sp. MUM 203J]
MSFGGPQWPQDPQQQGGGGFGPPTHGDPYQPYGEQPAQPYAQQQQPARPETDSHTPDWGALADASAARHRRKRWLLAGGGVLATGAIATLVAVAVISTSKNDADRAGTTTGSGAATAPADDGLPADPTAPAPSFSSVAPPPPPSPMEFLTTEEKDRAPLDPGDLFPGKKLTMGDRVYQKGALTSTTNCAAVGKDGLGAVLQKHGCTRVIRSTYTRDGVAVTVGVALFKDEAAAQKAKEEARGGILPLAGAGVNDFCRATVCLRRSNALGRYAYFTQAGFADGRKVTKEDATVFKTSDDLGTFTFNQIYARGRAQASAAATAPATGGQ